MRLAVRAYPYNQYVILTSNYWIGQSVRGDVSLPTSMEPLGVNASGEILQKTGGGGYKTNKLIINDLMLNPSIILLDEYLRFPRRHYHRI